MKPGEPVWLDDDIDAALVWQSEQDAKCPGCGQLKEESFDEASPVDFNAVPLVCRACATRDHAARRFAQNGDPSGLYFGFEKTERPTLD